MIFILPYIVQGAAPTRSFVQISGSDISAAAASAEIMLRRKYSLKLGRAIIVAVAHVDYSNRNRDTGQPIPPPATQRRNGRRRGFGWRNGL